LWGFRAGRSTEPRDAWPEPYALEISGRSDDAAERWLAIDCPYDAAIALAASTREDSLRRAVALLDRIGAPSAKARIAHTLRRSGARVPRGKRSSTRENPAELTTREIEVLRLVSDGLRNGAIARRLFVSVKTIDHHVSSALSKLGASNRVEAVRRAADLGILGKSSRSERAK
jgi:DNA-binding NarL/FixJ family response regulator